MLYQELENNYDQLIKLLHQCIEQSGDEARQALIHVYAQQNAELLNNFMLLSISHLKNLSQANNLSDVILAQVKLIKVMNEHLAHSTQTLLDTTLDNIADYNEKLTKETVTTT